MENPLYRWLVYFMENPSINSIHPCGGFHSHGGTPLSLDGLFLEQIHL